MEQLTLEQALIALRNGLTVSNTESKQLLLMKENKIFSLDDGSEVTYLSHAATWRIDSPLYTFEAIKPKLQAGLAVRRRCWPYESYIFLRDNVLIYAQYNYGEIAQANLSWADLTADDWHTYDTIKD